MPNQKFKEISTSCMKVTICRMIHLYFNVEKYIVIFQYTIAYKVRNDLAEIFKELNENKLRMTKC